MTPELGKVWVERCVVAAGVFLVALGVIVFTIGWVADVDVVKRVGPGLSSMKVNTAIGVALLGAVLLMTGRLRADEETGRRWGVAAAASTVVLLGILTTIQYAWDLDFGIDNLVVDDTDLNTAAPGRMGLNTAISFGLAGAAWLLLLHRDISVGRHRAGQVALSLSGILPLVALAGYVFQVPSTRGIGSATEMALHTSLALTLATIAGLAATSWRGISALLWRDDSGGRLVRRLVVLVAGAEISIGVIAELAQRFGVLDGVGLQLALSGVLTLLVLIGVVVQSGQRLSREEAARATAEAGRQQSLADLEAITGAFGDVHVRLTPELLIRAVHGRHQTASSMDLHGEPLSRLLPASALEQCRGVVTGLDRTGVVRTISFERSKPVDGEEAPGEPSTYEGRLRLLDGGDLALVIRDVSAREQARQELERLTTSLERRVEDRTLDLAETVRALTASNEDLSQFAFAASHDLREPVRMTIAYAHRLDERYADVLDERGRTYLGFVLQGAERMRDLIDGLLAYSRAGQGEMTIEPTSLDRLVAGLVAGLVDIADPSAITVADCLGSVQCDPMLLRLAIQHVVTNALMHSRPGEHARVQISSTEDAGWLSLCIDDDGVGIPDSQRGRAQQLFQRLQLREDVDSAGVGLALAKRVAERHGGTLRIADSELGGARVELRLPVDGPPDASPPHGPKTETTPIA